ncbi:uncharacterized protein RCC_10503 [Ramularia collo-cygni]|uniref:Uncharacterized protein n=1 Tax=Ramularia collo-cygni TaxID=112498 RepID=A0A2D3VFS9_9PEZI|nr:uncharacterized protein RCC_10503 [Ramularia collo-cygni]CZT24775.1 uncharacterized protein RCC_10503 [Ramularia collo-cygni]
MQLTIISMILAVAAAMPVQERSLPYCDQVHVDIGFGPGPACQQRPSSLPYCDQVQVNPGYGPGPACVPRPSSYSIHRENNPSGLINCADVHIPPGGGLGPACYNPDLPVDVALDIVEDTLH